MTIVQHLIGPTSFSSSVTPFPQGSLSILTYNVLLPNSVDGWWNYKMYWPAPGIDGNEDIHRISSWNYRKKLLRQRLETTDADIVCLQEVSPVSFDDDFSFMKELGYDGKELFRKGRFRPATFWKTSKCQLAMPPAHKDRSLLTAFRIANNAPNASATEKLWYVLNVHLQAGKEGKRRLRQIHEGVRAVLTMAKKLKDPAQQAGKDDVALVVCGDMNGDSECAAVRYLEDGFVDETFQEDGECVCASGRKDIPLKRPMVDIAAAASETKAPFPTLVVPELISTMIRRDEDADEKTAYENPEFNDDMMRRLSNIFCRLASQTTSEEGEERVMNLSDVQRWLTLINGQVGRGSEFREAARQMGWTAPPAQPSTSADEDNPDNDFSQQEGGGGEEKKATIELPQDGVLTLDGFVRVYSEELKQGKFWGIAYDMAVLGEPLPHVGIFRARLDHIFCSSSVQPLAVMEFESTKPCPNAEEPSDHLPVAALLLSR